MKILSKLTITCVGILVLIAFLSSNVIFKPKLSLTEKKIMAQKVFIQLQKQSGVGIFFPVLKFKPTNVINAYASDKEIIMTEGMLNYLNTESEFAAVLGHEIGHVMLEHVFDTTQADSRLLESNADKYGVYLMLRAGYDVCAARVLWYKLYIDEGNDIITESHPSKIDRFVSLDFPQCPSIRL